MIKASLVLAAGAMLVGGAPLGDYGLAACEAATQALRLDFPIDQQDRRVLPDRSVYYWMKGRITNRGSVTHVVPPLVLVFRDSNEVVVFRHEIAFEGKSLEPGQSLDVERVISSTPRSAQYRELGWKPCDPYTYTVRMDLD